MVIRVTFIIMLLLHLTACATPTSATSAKVVIAGELFTLELMLDNSSRSNGMMHRNKIAKNEGMLFVFPDSIRRSFWMKNCFIDIDLIFLDSRGTITTLYEMPIESPKSPEETQRTYESRLSHYYSNGPSRFAIELQAGSIQRLKLRVNEQIPLDLNFLKSIAR
jgi:uncharacterized membrane protein (UPF0127 family)